MHWLLLTLDSLIVAVLLLLQLSHLSLMDFDALGCHLLGKSILGVLSFYLISAELLVGFLPDRHTLHLEVQVVVGELDRCSRLITLFFAQCEALGLYELGFLSHLAIELSIC